MKKFYTFLILCILSTAAFAQTICNASGNLMIFSNYDGGILNIVVDTNIPNLKIGVVTYEGCTINISGTFASNVTGVAYAGYNGSGTCSGSAINTSITGAPGGATTNISLYPPATLTNPNGYGSIICAYSCSITTNQGGCNTVDQVEDYFLDYFPGSQIYAHKVQYGCWSGSYNVSAGGTCCATPTEINEDQPGSLSLFPNPANENISFTFETPMNNGRLKILSPSGQLIKEENNINGNIANVNVSDISAGIYFVELDNSGTISRLKFIKN